MKNKENKFIPDLIVDYLRKNGVGFIMSLPIFQDATINDIVFYCQQVAKQHGEYCVDFERLIREAISLGYDKRYLLSNDKNERALNEDEFRDSFMFILKQLGILDRYKQQNIIIVGVGNGSEGEILYSDIENISIVDIAPDSLKCAKCVLPQATAYQESADKLESIKDSSFDIYISLRTYQSTYFDIISALKEARRILVKNGCIIVSVACGYLNNQNSFCHGLFNPHKGVLEQDRPNIFLNIIIKKMNQLNFQIIGVIKISTEIFIYAKK